MKVVIELTEQSLLSVVEYFSEYSAYLGNSYSRDSVRATGSGYLLSLCTGNTWELITGDKTLVYTGSRTGFVSQAHFLLGEGSDFVLFLNHHLCRYTVESSATCPSASNPFTSGEIITADMKSRTYELDPYESIEADLMFA